MKSRETITAQSYSPLSTREFASSYSHTREFILAYSRVCEYELANLRVRTRELASLYSETREYLVAEFYMADCIVSRPMPHGAPDAPHGAPDAPVLQMPQFS